MITNLSMPDFSLNAFSTRSCSSSGAMAMTTSTESGILLIGPELTPDFFLLLPLPFLPPPALKPPPPPKPPFSAIIAFSFSAVASFFVAVGTSAFTVASAASTSHHSFLASTSSGSLGKRTSGLSSVPSNIPTKSRPSSRFDLLTSSALMTLYSSFFFALSTASPRTPKLNPSGNSTAMRLCLLERDAWTASVRAEIIVFRSFGSSMAATRPVRWEAPACNARTLGGERSEGLNAACRLSIWKSMARVLIGLTPASRSGGWIPPIASSSACVGMACTRRAWLPIATPAATLANAKATTRMMKSPALSCL
mmetsp:Transcript_19356/g.36211  ORF Transcript_19356/g.36211 Transcript_19356/m.36211 type:complete len:309 (+) Transcript_19356:492-1418(+)